MNLPSRRFTSGVRGPFRALAARSPKTGSSSKAKRPAPVKSAKGGSKAKPVAQKPLPKIPLARPPKQPEFRPERLALRQMGRGRKPPNLPETPLLPPPPPSAPDFQGAAPTMHYGEAPVPPKKKSRKDKLPKSTAARAAEAARAAVWAVSSEKTTAQIEAAENAFEEALEEHKAKEEKVDGGGEKSAEDGGEKGKGKGKGKGKADKKKDKEKVEEKPVEPVLALPSRRLGFKDRWTFFREEIAREDDAEDPHYQWRQEMGRPRHEMFLPASEEGIASVETELKTKLPPSYREFNLIWGGGRLYTQEFREIRLVGALDLLKELKDRLCERMHAPWLPLADLGDGDYLAFDTGKPNAKGEYPVHWWYGGHPKKKVAASFQDWLEQLVASGGEAFWWEES